MSATFDFDKFIHRFIEIATSDCSIKGTLISATVTGSVKDPNVQVFQTVTIATREIKQRGHEPYQTQQQVTISVKDIIGVVALDQSSREQTVPVQPTHSLPPSFANAQPRPPYLHTSDPDLMTSPVVNPSHYSLNADHKLVSHRAYDYLAPSLPSAHHQQHAAKHYTQPLRSNSVSRDTLASDHYTAPVASPTVRPGNSSVMTVIPAPLHTINKGQTGKHPQSVMLVSGFPLPTRSMSQTHDPVVSTEQVFQHDRRQPLYHSPLQRRATDSLIQLSPSSTPVEDEAQDVYRRYSSPGKLDDRKRVRPASRPPEKRLSSELVAEQDEEDGRRLSVENQFKEGRGGVQTSFGGYDYVFVADVEDYRCPICFLVLREPFLTDCCGNHFCKTCIESVRIKGSNCPVCCKRSFNVMVNRGIERKIQELAVYCPQSNKGCRWRGSLAALAQHTDRYFGDCNFVSVECHLGCGQYIVLGNIEKHTNEECPRRPYTCKFCGHKGVYDEIPSLHWPVCSGYPVTCPYSCGVPDMARREIDAHVKECPARTIDCEYKYAGCTAVFPFNQEASHKQEETQKHLSLLSGLLQQLLAGKQYESRERQGKDSPDDNNQVKNLTKVLKEKEEEMDQLKVKVQSLQEEVEELRTNTSLLQSIAQVPPFYFTISDVISYRNSQMQWFSPGFYTHSPNGYKMCIGVDCEGSDEGAGTHLSVYANLMRGENDAHLRWPFQGVISIQLLNQRADLHHCQHDIPFVRDTPVEISGRVVETDIAESGLGVPKFILLSSLSFNRSENVEYLRNNTLKFCVSKVRLT